MKKLIPLFVLGAIGSANAQVVIDEVDFPAIGESITFGDDAEIDASLNFNLGPNGGGQTFDFSMLQTDALFDVGFYDPSTVQGGSDFPSADLAVDQIGRLLIVGQRQTRTASWGDLSGRCGRRRGGLSGIRLP